MIKPADATTKADPIFRFADDAADRKAFQNNFNVQPFVFQHSLSTDSRFEMDCIRSLALRLPQTLSFSGKLGIDKGWQQNSTNIDDALNSLKEAGSWIILKKVQNDSLYASLLSTCLSEIEALVHRRLEPLIESKTMSLILSSPGQTTPYHIDGDCNFLFQIQGSKAFYVADGTDRTILTELEEENFWAGDYNAAKYRPEIDGKARLVELKPGVGVHVPVIFPHWVKNYDATSMSLSINFRFHGSERADIFRANHFLRKVGLKPGAVGKSKALDSFKGAAYRGMKKARLALRGSGKANASL